MKKSIYYIISFLILSCSLYAQDSMLERIIYSNSFSVNTPINDSISRVDSMLVVLNVWDDSASSINWVDTIQSDSGDYIISRSMQYQEIFPGLLVGTFSMYDTVGQYVGRGLNIEMYKEFRYNLDISDSILTSRDFLRVFSKFYK